MPAKARILLLLFVLHLVPSFALDDEDSSSTTLKSRFLTQYNSRSPLKCNKFPRVCHARGSPGPDCCKKKCVNVKTDNLNCGECGKKCKFGWMCCNSKCVSVMYDHGHCGGCRKKCKKGSFCRYGMCSYGF
ncbi:hypothetical protein LUZ60_013320 [Juncus effusus]|nr:hypothetical protein LUZ60_013320 [Juncus effusus]